MLPKFFYSHTFKSQVLQQFLGFIIFKTIIKFLQYGLRIFAGFIHNSIMLLQSIWWISKWRDSVRRRLLRINMWKRMILKRLCRWWNFGRRGSLWRNLKRRVSVRMRLWRMTMWRRTILRRMMLKRLCRWWIFGRRDSL
jgi:hypothetical protein